MTSTAASRARRNQHDAEQLRQIEAGLRRQRRSRRIVVGAIGAVVAIVATFVIVGVTTGGGSSAPPAPSSIASPMVLADLTGVPASTLAAVGTGSSTNPPKAVGGDLRTVNDKPEVLYIGAEYCPFCAGQRWPLIQALSRFGTFSGLSTTRSAAADVHPNTPSFTFHGATYTSDYLTFTARELYTNERQGSGYAPLDKATDEEAALLQRYGGSFPLLDLGGRYVQIGASYDLDLLHGLEWEQIAGALADPKSDLARAIDGTANVITSSLCELTNGQPTQVCNAV
jgi:hypothetical protein